ncbi:MAG: hypothetical protein MUP85_22375 [Candidatus Lokiarchaeota archaeon]|nr:hypothetical protein [Candidatus Lokiarchaeota archaeon]
MNLSNTIQVIKNELDITHLNKQRQRYLESYLTELVNYSEKYPEVTEVPSSLAIFCDINPSAKECKIFDV